MANTSAAKLLERCLLGEAWDDELLRAALAEDGGRAFFRVVVERLGDLFDPRLCDEYARLFAGVIPLARPELRAADLLDRYQRVRRARVCKSDPRRVFVLSRVTLGADIAVTSVVLDAAKRRFPKAEIYFVGPQKNYELFAADGRIQHFNFSYPRAGSIEERLSSWPRFEDGLVIDPDSRLSQLGLLPVCREEAYFFFESRGYCPQSDSPIGELTRQWVAETFEIGDARAWIAPEPGPFRAEVAVSFGVGENPEKRIADPFEEELLRLLVAKSKDVCIDEGAGGEEAERTKRLCVKIPGLRSWSGAYAPFAHAIGQAKLYVGYDSAGQHAAAASGTPLLSIFAGFPSERFFQRWRPAGSGRIDIVKVTDRNPKQALVAAAQSLTL